MPGGISLRLPWPGATWAIAGQSLTQGYGCTPYARSWVNGHHPEPVRADHGGLPWHEGLDYGRPAFDCGSPVSAAGAGTILSNGTQDGTSGYGPHHVIIDHGPDDTGINVYSLYGHLNSNSVSVGQHVNAGDPIGECGALGNAGGCHLHFTVYHPLYHDVDPSPYLTGQAAVNYGTGAASATGILSPEMLAYYAWNAGIPVAQLQTAVAIALAESGGKINAIGGPNKDGTYDYGLWQINSSHVTNPPHYDKTKLLNDPAYNAQAMADISSKGTHWGTPGGTDGWSTYDNGTYKQKRYWSLAGAGVAGFTPGTVPADLTAGIGGTPDYGQPQVSWLPVDTTPQQPVTRYAIRPTTVAPGTLEPDALNRFPVAAIWVQDHWLPVESCSVTTTQFLTPGSYQATLSIGDVVDRIGADGLEQIMASGRTEAVIAMGYVADPDAPLDPTRLTRMIVGILDAPQPHYENATRTISFSGTDLSAIHSDGSATDSEFSKTALNTRSDKYVTQLVVAHNQSGYDGLSVDAPRPGSGKVGQLFGGQAAQIRASGVTEWDIITQLAAGDGFVAYYTGTTLYYGPYPASDSLEPLVLGYNVAGYGAGVVTAIDPVVNPHNARDYYITATSYDIKHRKMVAKVAGNKDVGTPIRIALPSGITGDRLQKRANGALALYKAAERTLGLTLAHPVKLATGQAVVLFSDEPGTKQFTGVAHKFYPTSVTYAYQSSPPALTMAIQSSCRVPSIANADTTLTG